MSKFNLGDRVFIDSRGVGVNSKPVRAIVSKVLNGGVSVVIDGTNGFYTINNSYVYKRRSIVGKTFKRNGLKLIKRWYSSGFDIPCGETLQILKHYRLPMTKISTYNASSRMSSGCHIPPHRLKRYYEEI